MPNDGKETSAKKAETKWHGNLGETLSPDDLKKPKPGD
jgi:hypothetical protein